MKMHRAVQMSSTFLSIIFSVLCSRGECGKFLKDFPGGHGSIEPMGRMVLGLWAAESRHELNLPRDGAAAGWAVQLNPFSIRSSVVCP